MFKTTWLERSGKDCFIIRKYYNRETNEVLLLTKHRLTLPQYKYYELRLAMKRRGMVWLTLY
jgi:hypothetical protein